MNQLTHNLYGLLIEHCNVDAFIPCHDMGHSLFDILICMGSENGKNALFAVQTCIWFKCCTVSALKK